MNVRTLVLSVVLLGGCYQTSEDNLGPMPAPVPNAADAVTLTGEVWTGEGCVTDSDCVATSGVGACQRAVCNKGECAVVAQRPGVRCALPAEQLGECQVGACAVDGQTASCQAITAPDGATCGEFFAGCGAAATCKSGLCTDPCDKGGPCNTGACTAQGCVYTPVDGGLCDDGNPCTKNDICQGGVCAGEVTCECASDADCKTKDTADLCDGSLVCKSGACVVKSGSVPVCTETGFEPCESNVCNPGTGECELVQAANGTACADGNDCTTGDMCEAGRCADSADVVCEWICEGGEDEDGDLAADCDDEDCVGTLECPATCGDGFCTGSETCSSCALDCGECPPVCGDAECNGTETCLTCLQDCPPVCGTKECGSDDCGGSCGTCTGFQEECVAGECVCQPACDGKQCGDDGCGATCGTCTGAQEECVAGACVCQPACDGKFCGDDGCGATCGTCTGIQEECVAGACICQPACDGKFCGDDGCGSVCGACAGDQQCLGGLCLGDAGRACASNVECVSGNCVDGVCCNTSCTGMCQTCGLPGSLGTCTYLPSGQDPANECPGASACDGAGMCRSANGSACAMATECISGSCVDGVCCNVACNGLCQACMAAKTGGADGVCMPINSNTDPDNECIGSDVCNGAGVCRKANGAVCTLGSTCLSDNCVDGVCCNVTCNGLCQACSGAKSGGADGSCAPIVFGTDPDNECAGSTSCDGFGGCTL